MKDKVDPTEVRWGVSFYANGENRICSSGRWLKNLNKKKPEEEAKTGWSENEEGRKGEEDMSSV